MPNVVMSLRGQVGSLLIALSILLVVAVYLIQELVVMPAFIELERTVADRNARRCVDALQRDLQSISDTANDWASWDETYQYVVDRNPTYEATNLLDQTFSNTRLNLICLVDLDRHIVWGEVRDTASLEKINVPDLFAAIQAEASPFTRHQGLRDSKSGILVTSQGPMLLASRPIVTTKKQGPIRGSLIMGRLLTPAEITDLAERVHVKLDVWAAKPDKLPPDGQRIVDRFAATGYSVLEEVDANTLNAYRVVDDLYGKPALLMRVQLPREIAAQGRMSTGVAASCSLVGGVLTLALMWIVLQRRIVEPLRQIAEHAERVGHSGDLKARLQINRRDEIGTLATEFDQMVEKLAESHKIVLDAAHRSGMAEVASEVLHNVGNAVNSASCSVELLTQWLDGSRIVGLDRAMSLLAEQAPRAGEFFHSDPRGPKLIDYLQNLNGALLQEYQDNRSEVERLSETVRHIRDVISAQQSFTGQSEFRQEVELPALVNEVLLLNNELLAETKTEVDVQLPALPELMVNKSKMTQVLVNLVRNASQAMQERPDGLRRLTISAWRTEEDGIGIEVRDTGCGFDDLTRAKLFTHGFTTKSEGNGFGLHYCANAVKSMGGTIAAASPGPGRGATFTVQLPHVIRMTTGHLVAT